MRWPTALLAAGLALSVGACAHGGTVRCTASPADSSAVADTVRAYYAALAKDDLAAAERLTAPGFYSFDGGKRLTNAELVALVAEAHASGTVLQWNIGTVDAHFDCNTAWAAWENVGAAGTVGAMQPVKWHESAMLRRSDGRWLIEFLHSSRARD